MDLKHFNQFMESYADYIKSDSIQKREILEHYFTRWSTVMCGDNVPKAITRLEEIFSAQGLRKDFHWVVETLDGAQGSSPENIYDLLYAHNNKIVVLQGFENVLKGENRYLFWKGLFEYYDVIHEFPETRCPKESSKYYDAGTLNRREQYYQEVNEHKLPNKFRFTGLVILLSDQKSRGAILKDVDPNYQISLRDRCRWFEIADEL